MKPEHGDGGWGVVFVGWWVWAFRVGVFSAAYRAPKVVRKDIMAFLYTMIELLYYQGPGSRLVGEKQKMLGAVVCTNSCVEIKFIK